MSVKLSPRDLLEKMRQVHYKLSKKVSRSLESSSPGPEGLVKLMTPGWLAPKGGSVICDGNRFNNSVDVVLQACLEASGVPVVL